MFLFFDFRQSAGLQVHTDDVLVWGGTREKHDESLQKVLARPVLEGLTFNAEKCIFGQREMHFFRDKTSPKGIEPNPELVSCVAQHPTPTTKNKRKLSVFWER